MRAGRRDATRVEEEPELLKEVKRGAPAAAVCGEGGRQDSDAPGRAKEVTGDCTALGTSALVVFSWAKSFCFVFLKRHKVDAEAPEGSWKTPGRDGGRCG